VRFAHLHPPPTDLSLAYLRSPFDCSLHRTFLGTLLLAFFAYSLLLLFILPLFLLRHLPLLQQTFRCLLHNWRAIELGVWAGWLVGWLVGGTGGGGGGGGGGRIRFFIVRLLFSIKI